MGKEGAVGWEGELERRMGCASGRVERVSG